MANNVAHRPQTTITIGGQSRLLERYIQERPEELDELGAGIVSSFPILSLRGGKWRIKYRGEETPITDDRGYPRPDLEVIIVMSPRHKSKAFYPGGFDEANASVAPWCWASDGKVPDASVPAEQVQSNACGTCEQDKIGSKLTDAGKKIKACGDHKRMVLVPAGDILNETFGGEMLFRVPASSLVPLQEYGQLLKSHGQLYYGCSTTLSFDPETSFPKVQFDYGRPLTDDEVGMILEIRDGETVRRILNEEVAVTDPTQTEPVGDEGQDEQQAEQPTPQSNPQPAPVQQRVQPAPQVVQPTRVAPQATQRPAQQAPVRAAGIPPAGIQRPAQTPAQPQQPAPQQRPVGAGFGGRAPVTQTTQQAPQATATPARTTGGFGATKSTGVPTNSAGTINSALARPAVRPPTGRPVVQQAQPQQQAQPLGPPMTEENLPEETGAGIPDELDESFGKLMA